MVSDNPSCANIEEYPMKKRMRTFAKNVSTIYCHDRGHHCKTISVIKEMPTKSIPASEDSNSYAEGSIDRIGREVIFLYENEENFQLELLNSEGKKGT